jgi:signal transduction histidine kinase
MNLSNPIMRQHLTLALGCGAALATLVLSVWLYGHAGWSSLPVTSGFGIGPGATRLAFGLLAAVSLVALLFVWRQGDALQALAQQRHAGELVDRARLEAEVALRTGQLTELALHLQNVREDERGRLARDLHDELGALLTSAKLDAARIRSRLGDQAPQALERLNHLVGLLDSVIELKRRISEDLRPAALSHLGLVATLEILAHEFAAQVGVAVHCALEPLPGPVLPSTELAVYRLVQEALNNVSKHARARQVWLGLQADAGGLLLSVRDDGQGFDPLRLPRVTHGLLGMRFRVEAEQQGRFELLSAPGQGTLIRIRLPLSAPAYNGSQA